MVKKSTHQIADNSAEEQVGGEIVLRLPCKSVNQLEYCAIDKSTDFRWIGPPLQRNFCSYKNVEISYRRQTRLVLGILIVLLFAEKTSSLTLTMGTYS
jgi:hypothetical protein